ncbi:hypothetical protein H0H87_009523 [Tephrocybe sp. NHM501043]|nr:hypothetical protein H0H87_009523 [Tephrocybe sp. NHM501043]
MLKFCDPGVANSGGPDSSCLLFLIHRYLSEEKPEQPRKVVSLTVDHALQPISAGMANHCSQFAQKLGVDHVTTEVCWGQDDFPPRPLPDQPFEAAARLARYRALFRAMTEKNVKILAFGHHLDDQVETSLMRLSWRSTSVGAGGMRPCRRWGMGKVVGGGSEYAEEGMKRWIVRPMLNVTKERILATCDANGLEYVTDPTNFEPAITLRNAIRHEIQQAKEHTRPQTPSPMMPREIVERLMTLEITAKNLPNVSMSLDSSIDELRDSVRALNRRAQDLDDRVDSALKRCSLPTLPGTFLFSKKGLNQVDDPEVQRALVLRVVRHISPYPWGSINADAGRRREATDEIIKQLWMILTKESRLRPFTAGGGVLWSPAVVRGSMIHTPEIVVNPLLHEEDVLGWLASRLPPLNREKLKLRGIPNTLEIDVTQNVLDAHQRWNAGGSSTTSVLYDSRFLVHFHLDRIPRDLISQLEDGSLKKNRLLLLASSRWYWPKIVIDRDGDIETLHDKVSDSPFRSIIPIPTMKHAVRRSRRIEQSIDSDWVTVEWIRPMTAL